MANSTSTNFSGENAGISPDTVLLCDRCGFQFDLDKAEPGDPCRGICSGHVKTYDDRGDFAAHINMLDRVHFTVADYQIPKGTGTGTNNRMIRIKFDDHYDDIFNENINPPSPGWF